MGGGDQLGQGRLVDRPAPTQLDVPHSLAGAFQQAGGIRQRRSLVEAYAGMGGEGVDIGEGRVIDFKNTLILLTTNVGTETIDALCADPELRPDHEGMAKAIREPLLKIFPPALLGRIVTIPYYPLSDEVLGLIAKLQIGRIKKRVEQRYKVPFNYTEDVIKLILSRCTETESGGRMIDAILTNTMLPDVSRAFLNRMLEGHPIASVSVDAKDGQFVYHFD